MTAGNFPYYRKMEMIFWTMFAAQNTTWRALVPILSESSKKVWCFKRNIDKTAKGRKLDI